MNETFEDRFVDRLMQALGALSHLDRQDAPEATDDATAADASPPQTH